MDTVQRKNTHIKEDISKRTETEEGRILDMRRQERALPPSKHFAGSRFMAAKNMEDILNKRRSIGMGKALKAAADNMFMKGPARHRTASFEYEQRRESVSIIAPVMAKLIHFMRIFKSLAAAR